VCVTHSTYQRETLYTCSKLALLICVSDTPFTNESSYASGCNIAQVIRVFDTYHLQTRALMHRDFS